MGVKQQRIARLVRYAKAIGTVIGAVVGGASVIVSLVTGIGPTVTIVRDGLPWIGDALGYVVAVALTVSAITVFAWVIWWAMTGRAGTAATRTVGVTVLAIVGTLALGGHLGDAPPRPYVSAAPPAKPKRATVPPSRTPRTPTAGRTSHAHGAATSQQPRTYARAVSAPASTGAKGQCGCPSANLASKDESVDLDPSYDETDETDEELVDDGESADDIDLEEATDSTDDDTSADEVDPGNTTSSSTIVVSNSAASSQSCATTSIYGITTSSCAP